MHKIYIQKIIDSSNNQKMEEMADVFRNLITDLKDIDYNKYCEVEDRLYEISEGKVLNEERAKCIIDNMKPYGRKWTLEETEQVRSSYGYGNIRPIDFWVVMNSAYNDYKDIFVDEVEKYAMFSYAFINDEDAGKDKVYNYFTKIVK